MPPFRRLAVSEVSIRGERAFSGIAPYALLKRMLVRDAFAFRLPGTADPDRVLFLNLTFWNAAESSDLLVEDVVDADVLAHAGWHHAARRALAGPLPPTAAAMFLGESVASAFDLYVIGTMLATGRSNAYLRGQVPAISAAARCAGLSDEDLEALFGSVAADPDRAFEDLRQLLFDASCALERCGDIDSAAGVLGGFAGHRFVGLLHHFALSSWVLYARAYAGPAVEGDAAVAMDAALRSSPTSLGWLTEHWLSRSTGPAAAA